MYTIRKKEDDQEKSVKVDDMGRKLRELDICEGQRTDHKSKNQDEDPRSMEELKGSLSRIGRFTLWKNKQKVRNRKKGKRYS